MHKITLFVIRPKLFHSITGFHRLAFLEQEEKDKKYLKKTKNWSFFIMKLVQDLLSNLFP